jgi:hypothetical protein
VIQEEIVLKRLSPIGWAVLGLVIVAGSAALARTSAKPPLMDGPVFPCPPPGVCAQ